MMTALLEKQKTKQQEEASPEAAEAGTGVAPYHWTVEALYRALNAGVFEHPERLELIQGRIIENMAQDPIHRAMRVRLADALKIALMPLFVVMEECPVRIASDGELTPDVVGLRSTKPDYDYRHPKPEDVIVLVEVSNSTAAYDLGDKSILYAKAGIADYWVVLVNESAIVIHREPSPQGYQNVTRLAGTDTLSPLVTPEIVWTVGALLGRADTREEN